MFLKWLILVLTLNFLGQCESLDCAATPKNAEGRIRKQILCNYDKTVRPVANSKNGTLVKIRLIVKRYDFSDYMSEFTVYSWMSMKWTDDHLKWEKKDFDNIDSITIKGDEIWAPDLTIYNSQKTQFSESCAASNCVVSSNGDVACIPPCTHTGACQPDYSYWPFDMQNCSMIFGAWVHKGEEIDYQPQKSSLSDSTIKENRKWKLIAMDFQRHPGNFSCCPGETYPSIYYYFILQRHSAAEMALIFAPLMIFASLNVMAFLLDPTSMERIVLVIVSLISHIMIINNFVWYIPKNGDSAPYMVLFCRDSMIISAFILFQTVIMRGLVACTSATPLWVRNATESLRGNKVGQVVFSNDYLIKRSTLHNEIVAEDVQGLVEGQVASEVTVKSSEPPIWITTVKVIDRLLFLIFVITYIVMGLALIPTHYYTTTEKLNADISKNN